MEIILIVIGFLVLFAGMAISDMFTETVDKAFKKEPNDPG